MLAWLDVEYYGMLSAVISLYMGGRGTVKARLVYCKMSLVLALLVLTLRIYRLAIGNYQSYDAVRIVTSSLLVVIVFCAIGVIQLVLRRKP